MRTTSTTIETAEQILLRHLGCKSKEQLMNVYGIDLTVIDIIKSAMETYAQQQVRITSTAIFRER